MSLRARRSQSPSLFGVTNRDRTYLAGRRSGNSNNTIPAAAATGAICSMVSLASRGQESSTLS